MRRPLPAARAGSLVPLLALLGLAGCSCGHVNAPPTPSACEVAARLDRGDWMVRQGGEVWKVLEAREVSGETRPPRHVGYLQARDYRQHNGGPVLRLYEVTGLRRSQVLGRIDSLGRVTRYEPVRNGTFDERDLPSSSLENNVAAILDTTAAITLEKTDERHIAFEALDADRNGVLSAAELAHVGSRIASADRNGDKEVDFAEFDAIDSL